ncbi:MAG: helix-turn-helix domain-containing protein [Stenomitos rutilans HA7619-LM2]|nr:helix-turn-helix domain-containing protein [Stenomitos rutilans HA7619-LM2]
MRLTEAQYQLLRQLLDLPLLSPDAFLARWTLTYLEVSQICCCSVSTVEHWFSEGTGRRSPADSYQKLLAVADFLLMHGETVQHVWQS